MTLSITKIRDWIRKRAKMITLYGGAVGAVLTAVVAWNQLDMPRPALHAEVQAVQQYASNTRELVLNQEWFRLRIQLREAQAKLKSDPLNRELIRTVTRLEQALTKTNSQIQKLRK
jgi:hypothetical protein